MHIFCFCFCKVKKCREKTYNKTYIKYRSLKYYTPAILIEKLKIMQMRSRWDTFTYVNFLRWQQNWYIEHALHSIVIDVSHSDIDFWDFIIHPPHFLICNIKNMSDTNFHHCRSIRWSFLNFAFKPPWRREEIFFWGDKTGFLVSHYGIGTWNQIS